MMARLYKPARSPLGDVIDELNDLLVAAQLLSVKFHENGRPYLAMRARQLEAACHDVIDQIEAAAVGWEPVNHVKR